MGLCFKFYPLPNEICTSTCRQKISQGAHRKFANDFWPCYYSSFREKARFQKGVSYPRQITSQMLLCNHVYYEIVEIGDVRQR